MATFLYYADFSHYSYCENWIADALDRNGHHCLRISRVKWFDEHRLIQIAKEWNAEYVLLSKAPEIKPEQIRTMRDAGLKVIWWTFDWMRHPSNWEWYGPLAKVSDLCFQTDGWGEQHKYEADGIQRVELHQGCVPGLHDLPKDSFGMITRSQVDVAFIGSSYTERRQALISELTNCPRFRKWGDPDVQVWGESFAQAAYLSKIVVGDNFVNDVAGYWSDRVYLTLACGGFFLTAYVNGLEREFQNHVHLVWWHDFKELRQLIDYYLEHEAERRAIALGGYRLVHEKHTYDQRIQALWTVAGSL